MQRLNLEPLDQQGLEDFDLLALPGFPWREGEAPRTDPVAQQLRDQQRRFGIDAIKRPLLALVADNAATLSDTTLAQKLDVEPRTIARWREILIAEATSGVTRDPARNVAEDLLTLETIRRACLRRLSDSRTSDSALLASIDRVLRTMKEARDLKEAHGLNKPIHVEEPDPDPNHPDYYAIVGGRQLSTAAKVILVMTGRTLGIGDEIEQAIANDQDCGKLLQRALEERFNARVAEKAAELSAGRSTADPEGEPDDAAQELVEDVPVPVAAAEPTTIDEPDPTTPEPPPVIEPQRSRPQIRERIRPFDGLVLDRGR